MPAKKKVYDDVYGYRRISYESQHRFLHFLYNKLKMFEVSRYKAVQELLPSQGIRLLDIGCGDGDFIFMVQNRFKECYGIDVSSMRINKAQRVSGCDTLHFEVCDVDEGLPFPDQFFDVVTAIAVLEHLFNPPMVVKEINRVLKPLGVFVVQVPNIAWMPYRVELLFGRLPVTGGFYMGADWEHLHWFTKESLSRLLQDNGFYIEKYSCSGIFAKNRIWWISMLSGDLIVKSVKRKQTGAKQKC